VSAPIDEIFNEALVICTDLMQQLYSNRKNPDLCMVKLNVLRHLRLKDLNGGLENKIRKED